MPTLGFLSSAEASVEVLKGRVRARTLHLELDALQARVLAPVNAQPTSFFEITLRIENEECSEYAVVLIDVRTGVALALHRFPLC